MPKPGVMFARTVAVAAVVWALGGVVCLAAATDQVTLANGDRITGEVLRVSRGRLEFKTAHAGTLEIDWTDIVALEADREFEVMTMDGSRRLGRLGPAERGFLLIDSESVAIPQVTDIVPIGRSFWKKIEGSIDAGFSYTQSSGIAQTTFNADTLYRQPGFQFQVTASGTATGQADETRHDTRGSLNVGYLKYRGRRWFVGGGASLESNESLGLVLRSQVAGFAGPRLVHTNRAEVLIAGGLVVNNEQNLDAAAVKNVEGLLSLTTSYYSYSHPKTSFDTKVRYYPSFSQWGRQRVQIDTGFKHELLKGFNVGMNLYDTFDSAPNNPAAARNDLGITASTGWSFRR